MNRRKARENAFCIIFEAGFQPEQNIFAVFEVAAEEERVENDSFFEELVFGVSSNITEIDSVISRHLHQWKKERMSRVCLAVLRLAAYEILYSDISDSIAANEAVELCKKYDTEEGASFVNGVLGSIIREKE